MKKKKIIIIAVTILSLILIFVYNSLFSVTNIAFVNYRAIELSAIAKANNNSFIKISDLSLEKLSDVEDYDMVFVNGMGLKIVEEQRDILLKASEKGVPILTTMATNPENNISNLDSSNQDILKAYLAGGRKNYQNLLNFVRNDIDCKIIFNYEVSPPEERAFDILYHIDPKNENEELEFHSVLEYENFLKANNLYKQDGKRILITGQMADATDLITALEKESYNVYPVLSVKKLFNFLVDIRPDMVINLAHGRLGDKFVNYLKENNILLLAPLTVNSLVEDWEDDAMGMSGGFLSQSVVTPEIDGAIRSYLVFAQYNDDDGLRHSFAVPERLEKFVQTVNNYFALAKKSNAEKRVAVYYYKGPGQSALSAAGMEVVPSLYMLLKRLKQEGYKVTNLPNSSKELEQMIMKQGVIFGDYASGAIEEFMKSGAPELISKEQSSEWIKKAIRPQKYQELVAKYGEFPGSYMVNDDKLGIAKLQFGNVVLLPQSAAGFSDNSFQVVHGTNAAPPHTYVASYLWTRYFFKADALIHFGTHGSLEFTPKKQVALSSNDWSDALVGDMPHFYIYSIGNVGEAMIAKRRSYATLQSYLTPPFMESSVRGIYRELNEAIKIYNNKLGVYHDKEQSSAYKNNMSENIKRAALDVKKATVKLGIHRELGLDSNTSVAYSEDDILRIENFAEELAMEKITGQLYTMGVPYENQRIISSVYAMTTDPIAYSVLALDKQRKKVKNQIINHKTLFLKSYLEPAKKTVEKLLKNPSLANDKLICQVAKISQKELDKARKIHKDITAPKGMMAMMMAMQEDSKSNDTTKKEISHKKGNSFHDKMVKKMGGNIDAKDAIKMAKAMGADEKDIKKMEAKMKGNADGNKASKNMAKMRKNKATYSKDERNMALAIIEIEQAIKNVGKYKNLLLGSPENELASLINGLNGGYTAPSPGGDPIVNPNTLPTGRNMFAINAEETPTESAWEKGVQLAKSTIEMYKKRHNGQFPRKVSYTFWSGEFIETGGATIAQALYMLGVEPIRDTYGRINDIKLIPSSELGRPRIDVVVQTSGQLRDLAASRLFLINRAVEMAAAAKDDEYENMVAKSIVEAEKVLTEKGLSPKEAREMSTFRVFGGTNGNYGTGIQGMVEAGDKWEDEKEIASTYLNNMGAFYGSEKNWEMFKKFAFEAALTRTDVVVQPRQSNTWGALSLDHVYEFMGGMNLAVRNITGKDPDAYLSDYRNRNNNRMQEIKEAIGIESRTTILNPTFIKEQLKGEASSAGNFVEVIKNTYGWNVMKPSVIDDELWNDIYDVYVEDKFNLDIKNYFESKNPTAIQEITAIMLETNRKGMWKASEEQIKKIIDLHTEMISKYKPACTGFVCDNAKLSEFIAQNIGDKQTANEYKQEISKVREAQVSNDKEIVMKKEQINSVNRQKNEINSFVISGLAILTMIAVIIVFIRKKQKQK
ncbi:MAG: cobaltochelatase subunit CobN [Ignavibacteria bacterium]|nr:cobaltochelatase subunit CobN [Ignavibacteria bacterium]